MSFIPGEVNLVKSLMPHCAKGVDVIVGLPKTESPVLFKDPDSAKLE